MNNEPQIEQIYVALLNEGTEVRRPVKAVKLYENVYRIVEQPYDREDETWQFKPGYEVVCELIDSSDGKILAAMRIAVTRTG